MSNNRQCIFPFHLEIEDFMGWIPMFFSLQQEESKADTMLAKGQCISEKDCKIEETMKGKHLKKMIQDEIIRR